MGWMMASVSIPESATTTKGLVAIHIGFITQNRIYNTDPRPEFLFLSGF